MKNIASLALIVVVLLCGSSHAHEDTPLKLEKGKITGLPKKYQPAAFDRENKVLTIAGKRLVFPEVLHRLFTDGHIEDGPDYPVRVGAHPYRLTLAASWYHELEYLPPYLLIKIEPKGRDYFFELLIDLDRSVFIEARVEIAVVGSVPIDLDGVVDSLEQAEDGEEDQEVDAVD